MVSFVNIPFGNSHPLGATCYPEGVNFSIFSKNARQIDLLLFDSERDAEPSEVYKLDPQKNRTFYYWHIFLPGIKPGQLYGYRAYGPKSPTPGDMFDENKLLIDPYARALAGRKIYSRQAARSPGNNFGSAMKCVVVDPHQYDWGSDLPIQRPYSESIIYEMHVGGFTKNPNSGIEASKRGTYLGLIEKIPYLKELGVTAVELMPVQFFDEQDAQPGLSNYWGYSQIAFFAPHSGYGVSDDPIEVVNEFREMVKALHRAGIEVILDVVFNHTAEGGMDGPILSFRGLENKAYYILNDEKNAYLDYSGCGNTVNANHSIVRRMIMDCLRSWVTEYHIDGFRFDLASVLSRDELGEPLENPPVLWEIESDPVLAGTKIIAEAWDAAGLYQVGSFIGDRWAEWNGKYRDHVRRFMKGDKGMISKFASKIMASPDIYMDPAREPNRSIHFVSCHDGFTLNDLVSYNLKHNEANLEDNRDGSNTNFSWNCGVEGETFDPYINELRLRQIKNFLTLTFISQGTPMLLMGDEVRRSQRGNNNTYCQDNATGWFDWELVKKHADLLGFVKGLIAFTLNKKIFKIKDLLATPEDIDEPHITWHGVHLNKPDWSENSRSLAFTLFHPAANEIIHVIVNAYWKKLKFQIPKLVEKKWYKIVDTSEVAGKDFSALGKGATIDQRKIQVPDRSIIVMMAK
ncbi:MAG: glycogen debranching protein GlgX [Cytophagales bacterium]|nr:glycogen debranching protein GlgX [Cytophagales bacterium]